WRGGADGDQAGHGGEPLLAGVGVAEGSATGAAVRDRAAAAGAGLHAQQHRAIPVAVGLVVDAGGEADGLRGGLVVVHELDLAAAGGVVRHAPAGGDAGDELLVGGAADGGAGILFHEPLRCVEDTAGRAADILAVDEEAGVALDDLD